MRPLQLLPFVILPFARGIRIIQSNDDGWAEINIRAFYDALTTAGEDTLISAPAENESGTSSLDLPPTTVGSSGCEFSSCPAGSPPIGSNSSNNRLNYVNSYPVTSIKTGIDTTGPKIWNGAGPQLAVTGPNVGSNVGLSVQFSGTVGAAVFATHERNVSAIAFSGTTGDQTAWNQPTPLYSQIYADLAVNVTQTVIASGTPYLPNNVWLNVNFPAVSSTQCRSASQFKFILTRINSGILSAPDTNWCGSTRLPTESDVNGMSGCYVSISPGDATDKTTANAVQQAQVLAKLKPILSCLPS